MKLTRRKLTRRQKVLITSKILQKSFEVICILSMLVAMVVMCITGRPFIPLAFAIFSLLNLGGYYGMQRFLDWVKAF